MLASVATMASRDEPKNTLCGSSWFHVGHANWIWDKHIFTIFG